MESNLPPLAALPPSIWIDDREQSKRKRMGERERRGVREGTGGGVREGWDDPDVLNRWM
jgi:hypothetical protein